MSDASTFEIAAKSSEIDATVTGSWGESFVQRMRKPRHAFRIVAGLVCILAATPATTVADIWFIEKRRRESATSWQLWGEVVGRPVSRTEALRVARRALERAERRRMETAEFEAARGIQWEDEQ